MTMPRGNSLEVLYEDNHLLAINKPALLPTMGVAENVPSALTVVREWLRQKYDKPGNIYLGVVSRLDAPVTGVLLLAKTSKAASRLTDAFRRRDVVKAYLAAVEGRLESAAGTLIHYLRKDERHRKMHTTHAGADGAQEARLTYAQLSSAGETSLVEVHLDTGRKHQIRVQLAKVGYPIVGDHKYGSRVAFEPGIALHSQRLEFEHPVRRVPLVLEAPLPASWHKHRLVRALIAE
jgi:23S rRNA pseudouridine1911/1915/1917 synthase